MDKKAGEKEIVRSKTVTQKEKYLDGKGEKLQQKDIAKKTRTKARELSAYYYKYN